MFNFSKLTILILVISVLNACSSFNIDTITSATSANAKIANSTKLQEQNRKEFKFDKNDENYEAKQNIEIQISKLAGKTWKERDEAQKKLFQILKNTKTPVLKYFLQCSINLDDPEVNFRMQKILEDYFRNKYYNPKKKKGFIGLQLLKINEMIINKVSYMPVRVLMPQDGFPGQAAGIQPGDVILKIDDKIFSKDFTIEDFIIYIAALEPGTNVKLLLLSNKKIITKNIKLVERPTNLPMNLNKKPFKELFKEWYLKEIRN